MKRILDCILAKNYQNSVDHYAVAVRNDFVDDVPSRFENSFRSDPACYVAKHSKYKHYMKPLQEKISRDE